MKKNIDKIIITIFLIISSVLLYSKLISIKDFTIIITTSIAVLSYLFQKSKEIEIKKRELLEPKFRSILVFMSITLTPESIIYSDQIWNNFIMEKIKLNPLDIKESELKKIKNFYLN